MRAWLSESKNPGYTQIFECRRWESNPHSRNGNYALNVARLPIPPLRQVSWIVSGKQCRSSAKILVTDKITP